MLQQSHTHTHTHTQKHAPQQCMLLTQQVSLIVESGVCEAMEADEECSVSGGVVGTWTVSASLQLLKQRGVSIRHAMLIDLNW